MQSRPRKLGPEPRVDDLGQNRRYHDGAEHVPSRTGPQPGRQVDQALVADADVLDVVDVFDVDSDAVEPVTENLELGDLLDVGEVRVDVDEFRQVPADDAQSLAVRADQELGHLGAVDDAARRSRIIAYRLEEQRRNAVGGHVVDCSGRDGWCGVVALVGRAVVEAVHPRRQLRVRPDVAGRGIGPFQTGDDRRRSAARSGTTGAVRPDHQCDGEHTEGNDRGRS